MGTALGTGRVVAAPPGKTDPARVSVPLDEIQPPVEPPVKPGTLTPLSERSARQIAAATKLIAEQRFTEAALELERALRYDPNHPDIHRALATLHWRAGNSERAEVHAARTRSLNPADAAAHLVMGWCHAQRGDHADAITSFRTALACPDLNAAPDTAALIHFHLAQSLEIEGYLEAALGEYAAFDRSAAVCEETNDAELTALLRVPGGAGSKPRARILELLGRHGEAAAALAPVVNAAADEKGEVTIGYAELLARAGRVQDALEAVRGVVVSTPDVLRLLADLHARQGSEGQWIADLAERRERSPRDAALALELARALSTAGQTERAQKVLDEYLREYPGAVDVRLRRAAMQMEGRQWDQAIRTLSQGISIAPNPEDYVDAALDLLATVPDGVAVLLASPPAEITDGGDAYFRGALAVRQGRSDQAEAYLKRALQMDGSSLGARELLAQLYLDAYRYDYAMAVVARRNPEVAESARLERVLGKLHERLDELDRAEVHFRAALQLDRSDEVSALGLADVYQKSGRTLQAQRQLRALLEESPLYEEARERLAFTYWREGKLDEAKAQFEKLAELAETPATKARCQILLADFPPHDYTDYRNRLLASFEEHGATAVGWLEVAESYNGMTELEPMRDAYLAALVLDPDSERAHLGLVRTLTRLLEYEKAIEHLESLLPRRPNRHAWRLELIDLLRAVQDFDDALKLAQQEEAKPNLDDDDRRAYRLRILDTLRLAKREDERLPWLERWAGGEDPSSEWLARLATEYQRIGESAQAVPILQDRLRADPTDRGALALLANGLVEAGKTDRACQYVLDWVHEDPEGSHAMAQLVAVLGGGDRLEEALRLSRNQLYHTEYREFFQTAIIQLLQQAERYDQSIGWIESLMDHVLAVIEKIEEGRLVDAGQGLEEIVLRPDEPYTLPSLQGRLANLRAELAQTLIQAKEYRDAEDRISSWLEASRSRDTSYTYLNWLSVVRQAMGEEERATEALEKALLLDPEGVRINNDLAYSWIDRGIRLVEAERMIRYAVWRAPDQAAYLDTLAWLQYKKGDFTEALKWLGRAMRIMAKTDAVLNDHLGDTYWRLGDKDKAIESWSTAMKTVSAMEEDQFLGADSRRVRDNTQTKIDDARAGRPPKVAALAAVQDEEESGDSDGTSGPSD